MSVKRWSMYMMLFVSIATCKVNAQQHLDPEYIKVTNERASKIVEKLELSNPEKEQAVTTIIAQQYRNLSKIHDERDSKIEAVKNSDLSKDQQSKEIGKLKSKADKLVSKLHKSYLKSLNKQLSEDKVSGVKDGMTYGVLPLTYAGYLDMLPNLTEKQKKMIYDNLIEAREHAIDGGSSKEKHAWFGKFKGRINNNLSADGYDLHKESKDWHERVKKREKNKL
ncbi:DUF3826 domain-containing protein [Mariniflexile litorale]|uniref:DUF3826 domain-containing protein n=1 Tax=Mariniflexile litorale TaxID=3045158 RepID=A0AAU7EAC9_9FLAO|nr:DUF3826 domain-containing protein [Mariniflexile sp. KMM 9835]MDQ8210550.1 DUF3826 domain-containing protein [Mariniflexile sp. KMM 9835]